MSTIFVTDSLFKENAVDFGNMNLISGSENVQTASLQLTESKNYSDKITMSKRSYNRTWIAQCKGSLSSKCIRFLLEDQKSRGSGDWMADYYDKITLARNSIRALRGRWKPPSRW